MMLPSGLLLCFSVTAVVNGILFESRYYTIDSLSSVKHKNNTLYWNSRSKTAIEKLYAGDLPDDTREENYGDLEFIETDKKQNLIMRDTIVNDYYDEDTVIRYKRKFPGFYVSDMKVLNIGRHRGYCHSATILHGKGEVSAEIIVKAGIMVRMFVETYGYRKSGRVSDNHVKR